MKKLIIGIRPIEEIREMTIAIAKGEYKLEQNSPTVWFPSMKALCEILSDSNRKLLHAIKDENPQSIKELAELTNRQPSNVSRTIKTMSGYGLVEIERKNRNIVPKVKSTEFLIQVY